MKALFSGTKTRSPSHASGGGRRRGVRKTALPQESRRPLQGLRTEKICGKRYSRQKGNQTMQKQRSGIKPCGSDERIAAETARLFYCAGGWSASRSGAAAGSACAGIGRGTRNKQVRSDSEKGAAFAAPFSCGGRSWYAASSGRTGSVCRAFCMRQKARRCRIVPAGGGEFAEEGRFFV